MEPLCVKVFGIQILGCSWEHQHIKIFDSKQHFSIKILDFKWKSLTLANIKHKLKKCIQFSKLSISNR
jgi:hypothetical protein